VAKAKIRLCEQLHSQKKHTPKHIVLNNHPEQIKNCEADIFKVYSTAPNTLNTALETGFLNHFEDARVKRTHLFNGRYENIYITNKHIPELDTLLQEACVYASKLLNIDGLQAGCWFNNMPPGAITTAHSHDDDDELLSAVYYVVVPENSGDLIIHTGDENLRINPEVGMFVFFKPDVVHEVTENLSSESRLSIGINFGLKQINDLLSTDERR